MPNKVLTSKDHVLSAAVALKVHGHKYSSEDRAKIRARITRQAKTLDATVDLANDDQATDFGNNKTGAGNNNDGKKSQAGKTRAQPRPFGGRFGKKGATNGEQAMPGANGEPPPPSPDTFIATANNLQIGQSFGLPNNVAKVKRLGSGYQLYKMDGTMNKVVKSLPEVHAWIKTIVKGVTHDGSKSANQLQRNDAK